MVKEKPNSIRTYDKDGYRLRAACVCVKDDSEQEVGHMLNTANVYKLLPMELGGNWVKLFCLFL